MQIIKKLIAIALSLSLIDPGQVCAFHALAPAGSSGLRLIESLFGDSDRQSVELIKQRNIRLAAHIRSLVNTKNDVTKKYSQENLKKELLEVLSAFTARIPDEYRIDFGELFKETQVPSIDSMESLISQLTRLIQNQSTQFYFLIPDNKTPRFGFVDKDGTPVVASSYSEGNSSYFSAPEFNNLKHGEKLGFILKELVSRLVEDKVSAALIGSRTGECAHVIYDRPNINESIIEGVKKYFLLKLEVLDAVQNNEWEMYAEKRTELIKVLDRVYPPVRDFSYSTMKYIFSLARKDTDLPDFISENPLEIHQMRTPDFDRAARTIIEEVARGVAEEVFDTRTERRRWIKKMVESVEPWKLEVFLPETFPEEYKDVKSEVIRKEITQVMPALVHAGGFFSFIYKKNYFPKLSDPIIFRFALKHEFIHFLAHHNIFMIPDEFEFVTTGVHVLELADLIGEENLPLYQDKLGSPCILDLFNEGKRIAREGLVSFYIDRTMLESGHYLNIAFLEERVREIYRKHNIPLAGLTYNEMMEREVGVLFAGIMAHNREENNIAPLKTLKGLLDALYARWRPPTKDEKNWALTRLLPRLQNYVQFALDCDTVQMQPADPTQELGFWHFTPVSNKIGIQTYVPEDLFPRDYDGVTDERRKEKASDRSFGHLFQSIYRSRYSAWDEAKKKLPFTKEDMLLARVLWNVVETPHVIRQGLLNNYNNINEFGDLEGARGAGRWIRLVYESKYYSGSDEEAKTLLSMLPLHLQFLDTLLYRWVFAHSDPEDRRLINQDVKKAVMTTRNAWIKLFQLKDLNEERLFKNIIEHIWPEYKALYEKTAHDEIQRKVYKRMQIQQAWPGSWDALAPEVQEAVEEQWNMLPDETREAIKQAVYEMLRQALEQFTAGMGSSNPRRAREGEAEETAPGMGGMPLPSGGISKKFKPEDFKQKLNDLQQMLGDMEQQIQSIQQQAKGISADTGEVSKDGRDIDERAGTGAALEGKAGELLQKVEELLNKAQALRNAGADFRNDAQDTHEHASGSLSDPQHSAEMEQVARGTGELKGSSNELQDNVEELEQKIADLMKKAEALLSSVRQDEEAGIVSSHAERVRNSADEVGQDAQDVSQMVQDVRTLLSDLKNLSERIAQAESKTQSAPAPSQISPPSARKSKPESTTAPPGKPHADKTFQPEITQKPTGLSDLIDSMRDMHSEDAEKTQEQELSDKDTHVSSPPPELVDVDTLLQQAKKTEAGRIKESTGVKNVRNLNDYRSFISHYSEQVRYFKRKFRNMLVPDEYEDEESGYQSGARLVDPVAAITGDGGFTRRTGLIPKGMRVSIGIDTSQSMRYNDRKRIKAARIAAAIALESLLPLIIELSQLGIRLEVEVFHFNTYLNNQSEVLLTYEESRTIKKNQITGKIVNILQKLRPVEGATSQDDFVLAQMYHRGMENKPKDMPILGIWLGDGNFGEYTENMNEIIDQMKEDKFPVLGGALGDPEQHDFMKSMFGDKNTAVLDFNRRLDHLGEDIINRVLKILSPTGSPLWKQWLASFLPFFVPFTGLLALANKFGGFVEQHIFIKTGDAPKVNEVQHPDFDERFNFYIRAEGNKRYLIHKNKRDLIDVEIELGPGGERVPIDILPYTPTNENLLVEILQALYPNRKREYTSVSPDGNVFIKTKGNEASLWDVRSSKLLIYMKGKDGFWDLSPEDASSPVWNTVRMALKAVSRARTEEDKKEGINQWLTKSLKLPPKMDDIQGKGVQLSPDGKLLAVSYEKFIRLIEKETGKILAEFKPQKKSETLSSYTPVFSPDGRFLAVRGISGKKLWLYELRDADGILRKDIDEIFSKNPYAETELPGYVEEMHFSPDGKLLSVQTSQRKVAFFELRDENGTYKKDIPEVFSDQPSCITKRFRAGISATGFSPDGRYFLVSTRKGKPQGQRNRIFAYEIKDQRGGYNNLKEILQEKPHVVSAEFSGTVLCFDFSFSGELFAVGTDAGEMLLYSLKDDDGHMRTLGDALEAGPIQTLVSEEGAVKKPVGSIRFSPDNKFVFVKIGGYFEPDEVIVYELQPEEGKSQPAVKELAEISNYKGLVGNLGFALYPDGKYIEIFTRDKRFKIKNSTHLYVMQDDKEILVGELTGEVLPDAIEYDANGWVYVLYVGNGTTGRIVVFKPEGEKFTIEYDLKGEEEREEIKVLNLEGEGGVGKGELIKAAYHLMNRPMALMSAHAGMQKEDFYSYLRISDDGELFSSSEEHSPLSRGSEFGWGVVVDEFNKTKESVRGGLLDVFQERYYVREGKLCPMHAFARIVVTGNPFGLHDIIPFNEAEKRRMKTIYVPWQSPEEELEILKFYAFQGRRLSAKQKQKLKTQYKNLIKIADDLRLTYMGYDDEQIEKIFEDWTLLTDSLKRASFKPAHPKGERMWRAPSPRLLVNMAIDFAQFPSYAEYRPWSIIRRFFNFDAEEAPQSHWENVETSFKLVFENKKDKEGNEVKPSISSHDIDDVVNIEKVETNGRTVKILRIQPKPTTFINEADAEVTVEWDPVEVILHPDAADHLTAETREIFETPSLALRTYEILQDRMPLHKGIYGRDFTFVGISDTNKSWFTERLIHLLCGPDMLSVTFQKGTQPEQITVRRGIKKARTTWQKFPLVEGMGDRNKYLGNPEQRGKLVRCSETNQANPRLLAISSDMSQNRRYMLPDGTEIFAGPGFGTIDNVNPPGSRVTVNAFSPEYLERRVIWKFDFYEPLEEVNVLFKASGKKLSPHFIGYYDTEAEKWKGLIAVILSLRKISIENPERLPRSPGLSITKDFVQNVVSYLNSTEENKDNFILRQFLKSYNVDEEYHPLIIETFKDEGLWNEDGTAVDAFMENLPLISEGLEVFREPKTGDPEINKILAMLQLTIKSGAIPEMLELLKDNIEKVTQEWFGHAITKRLDIPYNLVETYQILSLIIKKREHTNENKEIMKNITAHIKDFFDKKAWHPSVLDPNFDPQKIREAVPVKPDTGRETLDEYLGLLQIFIDKKEYIEVIIKGIKYLINEQINECKDNLLHECAERIAVLIQARNTVHQIIDTDRKVFLENIITLQSIYEKFDDAIKQTPFSIDEQVEALKLTKSKEEIIQHLNNMLSTDPKPGSMIMQVLKQHYESIPDFYRHFVALAIRAGQKSDRDNYIEKAAYIYEVWKEKILPAAISPAPVKKEKHRIVKKGGGISDWLSSLPDNSELPQANHSCTANATDFNVTEFSTDSSICFIGKNYYLSDGVHSIIQAIDMKTGRILAETDDLPGEVKSIACSHDGRFLAVGTCLGYDHEKNNNTVLFYELKDRWGKDNNLKDIFKLKPFAEKIGIEGFGSKVLFSPDDSLLAIVTAGVPSKVKLFKLKDYTNLQEVLDAEPEAEVEPRLGGIGAFDFSPDGRFLAIGTEGPIGHVLMYELKDKKGKYKKNLKELMKKKPYVKKQIKEEKIYALRFSSQGRFFAVGTSISAYLYQIKDDNDDYMHKEIMLEKPLASRKYRGSIRDLSFSPDERFFAIATRNPWIGFFELKDKNGSWKKDLKEVLENDPKVEFAKLPYGGKTCRFSPDNTGLVITAKDIYHIWYREQALVPMKKEGGISDWLSSLPDDSILPEADLILISSQKGGNRSVYSSDSSLCFVGDDEGILRIYDSKTMGLITQSLSLGKGIWGIDVSHDGRFLAVGTSETNNVLLFELKDEKGIVKNLEKVLKSEPYAKIHLKAPVWSISFSHDDNFLAVGTGVKEYKARLYKIKDEDNDYKKRNKILKELISETPDLGCSVHQVGFTPDGKFLMIRMHEKYQVNFYELKHKKGKDKYKKNMQNVLHNPVAEIPRTNGCESSSIITLDGRFLVVGTMDYKIKIFQLMNEKGKYIGIKKALKKPIAKSPAFNNIAHKFSFTPDGRYLMAGMDNHAVWTYEFKDKEGRYKDLNQALKKPKIKSRTQPTTLGGGICDLSVSPNGVHWNVLAGPKIHVWHREIEEVPETIEPPRSSITEWLSSLPKGSELPESDLKHLADLSNVLHVKHSPDGQFCAAGGLFVSVFDSKTGEFIASSPQHEHKRSICDLDFSPDGRFLAVAWADGKVALYELKNENGLCKNKKDMESALQKPFAELDTGYLWKIKLHFTPVDGKFLFVETNREKRRMTVNKIRIYKFKIEKGTYRKDLKKIFENDPHTKTSVRNKLVSYSCFSPDGRFYAVSLKGEKKVRIYKIKNPNGSYKIFHRVLNYHVFARTPELSGEVKSLSFSPDGKLLSAGTEDGQVIMYELKDESGNDKNLKEALQNPIAKQSNFKGSVLGQSFSQDGRFFGVTTHNDPRAHFFELKELDGSYKEDLQVALNTPYVQTPEIARMLWDLSFSPDNSNLVVAGGSHIHMWYGRGIKERKEPPESRGSITQWLSSLPEGSALPQADVIKTEAEANVHNTDISSDGMLCATGGIDHILRIYDAQTGDMKAHVDIVSGPENGTIRCVRFSPDARFLIIGVHKGRRMNFLMVFEIKDENGDYKKDLQAVLNNKGGNHVGGPEYFHFEINDICFSHNGELLVVATEDKNLQLYPLKDYDVKNINIQNVLDHTIRIPFDFEITSLDISHDNRYLAIGTRDKKNKILGIRRTVKSDKSLYFNLIFLEEWSSPELGGEVGDVRFSPNDEFLAAHTFPDNKVAFYILKEPDGAYWNFEEALNNPITYQPESCTTVRSLAFSSDSRFFGIGVGDKNDVGRIHISELKKPDGSNKEDLLAALTNPIITSPHLDDWVWDLCFSKDDSVLAATAGHNLHIWHPPAPSGIEKVEVLPEEKIPDVSITDWLGSFTKKAVIPNANFIKHDTYGYTIFGRYTSDGRYYVADVGGGVIHIYDVRTGKSVAHLYGTYRNICDIEISPDGRFLGVACNRWEHASGENYSKIVLFELKDENGNFKKDLQKVLEEPFPESDDLKGIAKLHFTPIDGEFLFVETNRHEKDDKKIRIYALKKKNGEYRKHLKNILKREPFIKTCIRGDKQVTNSCFSPDGELYVVGVKGEKKARIYEMKGRDGSYNNFHAVLLGDPSAQTEVLNGDVWKAVFSPDGHFLAIGTEDGNFYLFALKDELGREKNLREAVKHPVAKTGFNKTVWDISFSRYGRFLGVTAQNEKSACLFEIKDADGNYKENLQDVLDEQYIHTPEIHGDLWKIHFSPDNFSFIVHAGSALHIWHPPAPSGTPALPQLPDKEKMGITRWIKTLEPGLELDAEKADGMTFGADISAFAYSPDGKLLAVGYDSKLEIIINEKEGGIIFTKDFNLNVLSVCFSQDSKELAVGLSDKKVCHFSISGEPSVIQLKEEEGTVEEDANCIIHIPEEGFFCGILNSIDIDVSPDYRFIAVGNQDKTLELYEIIHENGEFKDIKEVLKNPPLIEKEFDAPVVRVRFSHVDGRFLAVGTGGNDCRAYLYTIKGPDGKYKENLQDVLDEDPDAVTPYLGGDVTGLDFSINGCLFAVGPKGYRKGGMYLIRDLKSGEYADREKLSSILKDKPEVSIPSEFSDVNVRDLSFSPNGNSFAIIYNRNLRWWNWYGDQKKSKIAELPYPDEEHIFNIVEQNIRPIIVSETSPDGVLCAVYRDNFHLYLYDIKTGGLIAFTDELPGEVTSLCFSPDGRFLFVGYADEGKAGIMIYDLKGDKKGGDSIDVQDVLDNKGIECPLPDDVEKVLSIDMSPDGNLLSVGIEGRYPWMLFKCKGANKEYLDFQKAFKEPIDRVSWTRGSIVKVKFSPDGRFLAASQSIDEEVSQFYMAELKNEDGRPQGLQRVLNSSIQLLAETGEELVEDICFSPDSSLLMALKANRKVYMKALKDKEGRCLSREEIKDSLEDTKDFKKEGNKVQGMSFSHDGSLFIVGINNYARIYNMKDDDGNYLFITRSPIIPDIAKLPPLDSSIRKLSFSQDDASLHAVTENKSYLWKQESVISGKVQEEPDENEVEIIEKGGITEWIKDFQPSLVVEEQEKDYKEFAYSDNISAFDYSPATKLIIIGLKDKFKVINATTREEVFDPTVDGTVTCAAFNSDGNKLCVGTDKKKVYEYNVSPTSIALKGDDGVSTAFIPVDLKYFAQDDSLAIMHRQITLMDKDESVGSDIFSCGEFSSDNEYVAVGTKSGILLIYKCDGKKDFYAILTNKPVAQVKLPGPITRVRFAHKNHALAVGTGEDDCRVRVYKLKEFRDGNYKDDLQKVLDEPETVSGHFGCDITGLSFSPNDIELCISTKGTRHPLVYMPELGKFNLTEAPGKGAMATVVNKVINAEKRDMQYLENTGGFVVIEDDKLRLWSTISPEHAKKILLPYPDDNHIINTRESDFGEITAREVSPDGKLCAVVTELGFLLLIDVKTGEIVASNEEFSGKNGTCLCFTPDGRFLFMALPNNGSMGTSVVVYELKDEKGADKDNLQEVVENGKSYRIKDCNSDVYSLSVSPDNNILALGTKGRDPLRLFQLKDENKKYKDFEILSKKPNASSVQLAGRVAFLCFSPDERFLAAVRTMDDGKSELYLMEFLDKEGYVLKDKKDDDLSLQAILNNRTVIWKGTDVETIMDMCFSPDSYFLTAVYMSNKVIFATLKLGDGTCMDINQIIKSSMSFPFVCADEEINNVSFSSDGSLFIMSFKNSAYIYQLKTKDGTLRRSLQEVFENQPLAVLPPLDFNIDYLDFSDDGSSLIATTGESMYIWYNEKERIVKVKPKDMLSEVFYAPAELSKALWMLLTIKQKDYLEQSIKTIRTYSEQYKGQEWFNKLMDDIKAFQGNKIKEAIDAALQIITPQLASVYRYTGFLFGIITGSVLMYNQLGIERIQLAGLISFIAFLFGYISHEVGHRIGGVIGGPVVSMILAGISLISGMWLINDNNPSYSLPAVISFIGFSNFIVHMFADKQILIKKILKTFLNIMKIYLESHVSTIRGKPMRLKPLPKNTKRSLSTSL